jgi:uncharacterized membrane protein YeaQ/YmgE (transglycosylase-associated protein family)
LSLVDRHSRAAAGSAAQRVKRHHTGGTYLAPGAPRRIHMHILWMLIIGLVVGALAKLAMPGKDPGGIIVTMLIGIAGSLIAGFLGRSLGWYSSGQSAGLIASFVGAIVLLAGYRIIAGRGNARA